MTRYHTSMSRELYREFLDETLTSPEGWHIVSLVSTDSQMVTVEVEDEEADLALTGKTVLPWFQMTTEGTVVISKREVLQCPPV